MGMIKIFLDEYLDPPSEHKEKYVMNYDRENILYGKQNIWKNGYIKEDSEGWCSFLDD